MAKSGMAVFLSLIIMVLASCSKDSRNNPGEDGPPSSDSVAVITQPLPSLDPSVRLTLTDISYGSSGLQKMDISLIGGRTATTPVVVLLHGGAWSSGDKKDLSSTAGYFISQGINVANINYRLTNTSSSSVRWTGILSDVNAAVTFLKLHADSLKIRNKDFVLFGFSAGAHLALLHAYSYDNDNLITAVIGFGTPTKLNDPAWKANPYIGIAKQAIPPLTGQAFTTDTNNVALKELSPYFGEQLKPTLLIHGDHDEVVPYSQSVLMSKELQASGVGTSFITLAHSGHTGDGASQSDLNNALANCAAWIRNYSH